MHTNYRSNAMRELRQQCLRDSEPQNLFDSAARAERLLAELNPERNYSYDYVYRKVAGKTAEAPRGRLSGEDISHDTGLLIEDLTDEAAVPAAASGERVFTVDELSDLFQVSTKTISRWRRQGLVSRMFDFGGRKRVGFLKSSVERFVSGNRERIRRSSRFRQMTDQERALILNRARQLAEAGDAPAEITRRLAQRLDRSVETIRYTIRQYDKEHPKLAIFAEGSGPLSEGAKEKIYQQFRDGVSVDELARRYGRNKTTVYRMINETRVRKIQELPLDFMPNPQFPRVRNDASILGPLPEAEPAPRKTRAPSGLPPYLGSLYEVPLLNREQEQHLFRKFNYLKYRASRLRDKLDPERPSRKLMDEIEHLYDEAVKTKNQIVKANLRLVVSIAKRHVGAGENFFELVSDGNISLMRAADKFDYARGNKFSTYASWAIMKNYARTIPAEHRLRDRFRTAHEETFGATAEPRTNPFELEAAQQQRLAAIRDILQRLDDREQKIIIRRFGLDHSIEPKTLKEVGEEMGVTKERVRQIEARALSKLRLVAQEQKLEPPEE